MEFSRAQAPKPEINEQRLKETGKESISAPGTSLPQETSGSVPLGVDMTGLPSVERVPAEWTDDDRAAAQAEGWDVFWTNRDPEEDLLNTDGTPYGFRPFEIQGINEMGIFHGDMEAQKHVLDRCLQGDATATRALDFLREHSPVEFEAVLGHLGHLNDTDLTQED